MYILNDIVIRNMLSVQWPGLMGTIYVTEAPAHYNSFQCFGLELLQCYSLVKRSQPAVGRRNEGKAAWSAHHGIHFLHG